MGCDMSLRLRLVSGCSIFRRCHHRLLTPAGKKLLGFSSTQRSTYSQYIRLRVSASAFGGIGFIGGTYAMLFTPLCSQ